MTERPPWMAEPENALSVQGVIESALKKATGEDVKLIGSGRTDTGVHALGQAANFHTSANIPPDKYTYVLNSLLPDDIVIKSSVEVDSSFMRGLTPSGGNTDILCVIPASFRVGQKQGMACQGCSRFYCHGTLLRTPGGTHDFSVFMAAGSYVENAIRQLCQPVYIRTGIA